MLMLTENDWYYLAGLADGEAWFGVSIKFAKKYSMGVKVHPLFQIALGGEERLLKRLQTELGGKLYSNRKQGYRWIVRSKHQVMQILLGLKDKVKFETNRERIELLLRMLEANPLRTSSDPEILKPLVMELRSYSKRKHNGQQYWSS